jgi:hypothetical protein
MGARKRINVDPELFDKLAEEARAENTTTEALARTALQRYLLQRHLQRLQRYGRRKSEEVGLDQDDLQRVIGEWRNDRRER